MSRKIANGNANPLNRLGFTVAVQINPGQAKMIAMMEGFVRKLAGFEGAGEFVVGELCHNRIIRNRTNLRLIFAIHRTTHRIGLFLQRHAPDVNQAEAHILCHLSECGDSTIGQLHRAFAHKRSTLTSVLDRLVERRLVTRESSREDRRSFVVALTRSGTAKAAKMHRLLEKLEAEALRGADRKSVDGFDDVIGRVERMATPDSGPVN